MGSHVTQGPSADYSEFAPVLTDAVSHMPIHRVIADMGYDSEKNHEFARKRLGIKSTVIPARKHKSGRLIPKTKYRRQMRQKFQKRIYRARVQIESVFSRIKRVLDARVRSRIWESQERECYLKIMTFNLMLLAGGNNS
jgi:transposase